VGSAWFSGASFPNRSSLAAAGAATLRFAVSLFITLEGIEGSGKSSHARNLAAALRDAGRVVVETREPGGTSAGAALRALLLGSETPLTGLAELFLYCADRTQHLSQVVRPALAAGRIVICDRFSDSTIAYQGYGRGLDLDVVRALDAHARGGLVPTLTFLLDCPVGVGLGRAQARAQGTDRFERETIAFHERIRQGFLAIAADEPERVVVIDSTRDATAVGAELLAATRARLEAAA
jgi:dTMP kinase